MIERQLKLLGIFEDIHFIRGIVDSLDGFNDELIKSQTEHINELLNNLGDQIVDLIVEKPKE